MAIDQDLLALERQFWTGAADFYRMNLAERELNLIRVGHREHIDLDHHVWIGELRQRDAGRRRSRLRKERRTDREILVQVAGSAAALIQRDDLADVRIVRAKLAQDAADM